MTDWGQWSFSWRGSSGGNVSRILKKKISNFRIFFVLLYILYYDIIV